MTTEILNALKLCNSQKEVDQVIDLAKTTTVSSDSVKKAIRECEQQGFKPECKVMMVGDPDKEIGKLIKFNNSTIGFYAGNQYPMIVKFDRGTFEFGIDELTLI